MREIKVGKYTVVETYIIPLGKYVFYVYDDLKLYVTDRRLAENLAAEAVSDEYGGGVFFRSVDDYVEVVSVQAA